MSGKELMELAGKPVKARLETTVRAVCPACQQSAFTIDHAPMMYGPWSCGCGARYLVDVMADGTVELHREEGDNIPCWMIVKIADAEPPIYFVIDSPIYYFKDHESLEEREESDHYFVEEHTCPTNLVPVEAIVSDGDDDPHGILEFVARVPKSSWDEEEPECGWVEMVERATGQLIEGTVSPPPLARAVLSQGE